MYLSARQVRERYHITTQTLFNWRQKDKIKFVKTPSGKYLYYPLENTVSEKKNVIYARVSNTKQKEDLIRQINILSNFMNSSGIIVDSTFSDIASGMNENRSGFNSLIEECVSGKISKVYITFKDRLTRFGFGYIEKFLKLYDVEIVVVNNTKEEDFQQELTQDLVSIIHHFSMKMYSNRRKKLKEIEKILSQENEII